MLLEKMRKGVSKIVIQILALLLIASFALWGVGDMVGVISNPDEIATIDGNRVSSREFQQRFRQVMEDARQRYGDIDTEQARALGLADTTLDGILSRHLLDLEAGRLGLRAGDELVAGRIRAEPAFRDSLGQFDRAAYQAVLANNGLTESTYSETIRGEVQRGFLTGVIEDGASAPPLLADIVFRFRGERRSAEFVSVARKDPGTVRVPSDAELADYFAKNEDAFRAPEYRRLSVLYLDPGEIAKEMEPDPERVREEYESRRASLSIPERRNVQQLLASSEESAKALHARLAAGTAFAAGGEDGSVRKTDLGLVARADLPPAIGEAAFALSTGAFSEPVRTPLGWHIVRVTGMEPGRTPSFDEVGGEIAAELALELALDDLVRQGNRLEDVLAGGGTLEEAASEVGGRVRTVQSIDAGGMSREGGQVDGLPRDRRFMETAFGIGAGETSDVVESADGGYFVLRVDDVVASARRPLSDVRDQVKRAWRADRSDGEAKARAEKILERARAGMSLKWLAEEDGLRVAKGGPVDRLGGGAPKSPLPPDILADLFSAKEREFFLSGTREGYAVARVTGIEAATPDRGSEEYRELQENLTGALRVDLLDEFTRALRQEYDVVINSAAMDALFSTQQY